MQKRIATRKTKGHLPVTWAEENTFAISVAVRPPAGPRLRAKPPTLIVPVNDAPAPQPPRRGSPRR